MLVGHRSDTHRSVLGWRRVPYIWFGTLLQFGGLAIMPFALILLSGDSHGPAWIGQAGAALAFLLTGAGLHTVQTSGLALATDLAPASARPRVVALLCLMLIVGSVGSALGFGLLLHPFSELRLIQVVQGAGLLTLVLNGIALWKQEARRRGLDAPSAAAPSFGERWAAYTATGRAGAARCPRRLTSVRIACVILAAPMASAGLFAAGVTLVGLGAGLFAHGTLTASMAMAQKDATGLALGAWGAVQAGAAGLAIAGGGLLSDGIGGMARAGALGATLRTPATGYAAVYAVELALLFATLVALGPLARHAGDDLAERTTPSSPAAFPALART